MSHHVNNGDRKSTYKLPPTTITDRLVSQEARRLKALEDQKRRRLTQISSSRVNLDSFSSLQISDSEEDDSVSVAQSASTQAQHDPIVVEAPVVAQRTNLQPKSRKKKKKKGNSKYADKCMYAEILELSSSSSGSDGVPSDLETGWIALPVPKGKRCLAVTYQGLGGAGEAVSAASSLINIHSRLLGKQLLSPFPSSLPPNTILDCVLDSNWSDQAEDGAKNNQKRKKAATVGLGNGILHVLDVIRWNGRDLASCEVGFRMWWRDTRLAELPPFPQSSSTAVHPTRLLPIPHYTDLRLAEMVDRVIPAARSHRHAIPPASTEDQMEIVDLPPPPIEPDGLLLYVKEASYESGTSPLSVWVPLTDAADTAREVFQGLDLFESLLRTRLLDQGSGTRDVEMMDD